MLRHNNDVPDRTLAERAQRQLTSRGLRAPCQINVQSNHGVLTLSGKVEYSHQRQTALQAARGVQGVRGVVDQLQVIPAGNRWQ